MSYTIPLALMILSAFGFIAWLSIPPIAQNIINKEIRITNGSFFYPIWKDLPLEIYQSFYFFNVTNPTQIQNYGAKPILKQIGPFTYKVDIHKKFLGIQFDNTISFREFRTFTFVRDLSVANDNTVITTLNAPLIIALGFLESKSFFIRELIERALETVKHGFFMQRTVKELTFDGYPDFIMELAPHIIPQAGPRFKGRFGYLFGQNNSDDGLYGVFNGENNIADLNLINTIGDKAKLDVWFGDECNSFNSSTRGEIFPPMRNGPKEHLEIFIPLFCRKFNLNFVTRHNVLSNLETYKYTFDPMDFTNSSENSRNKCFSNKKNAPVLDGLDGTLPRGVFDTAPCQFGSPLYISFPHFFNADPYFTSKVEGLKPDRLLHEGWLEVEPTSGASSWMKIRFQINLGVTRSRLFEKAHKMPNIIFPVFWMEFSCLIPADLQQTLTIANDALYFFPVLILHLAIGVSGLLIFLVFLKVIIPFRKSILPNLSNRFPFFVCCLKNKDFDGHQILINEEEEEEEQVKAKNEEKIQSQIIDAKEVLVNSSTEKCNSKHRFDPEENQVNPLALPRV